MLKKIKIILQLLFLQLTARGQFPAFEQLPGTNPLRSELDSIIQEQVRAFFKKANTPGLLIGISQQGERKYYSYGYADMDSKRQMDAETIFEIGSLTKTFTANLFLQLHEKGIVNINDPLSYYIPGVEKNDSVLSKILLKDILNHTSGLPRLPRDMDKVEGYTMMQPYEYYDREHLFNFLKELKKPGSKRYEYSNLGFGLLASILELKTGKSFEQLLTESVWQPLAMKNSFIGLSEKHEDTATGYFYGKPADYWKFDCMAGAGAVKSNAVDMLNYLEGNINPTTESLAHSIRYLTTPSYPVSANIQIGFAWHSFEDLKNRVWWHNGGTYGFSSFGAFDPISKNAVILMSNSSGANKALDKLGTDLMILLMGK